MDTGESPTLPRRLYWFSQCNLSWLSRPLRSWRVRRDPAIAMTPVIVTDQGSAKSPLH